MRLATSQVVQLADGRVKHAAEGDWLIAQGRLSIDVVGAAQLTTLYQIDEPGSRTFSAAVCDRLEQTTGLGSTRTGEELVKAVERLARIQIGTIHVDFTPGQLEEIHQRATKRGHTVEQELRAAVDRVKDAIFWGK